MVAVAQQQEISGTSEISDFILDTPITWTMVEMDLQKALNTEAKFGENKKAELIGQGNGFVSKIVAATLDWTENNTNLPQTVVIKITGDSVMAADLKEPVLIQFKFQEIAGMVDNDGAETNADTAIVMHNMEFEFYHLVSKWNIDGDWKIPKYYCGCEWGTGGVKGGYIVFENIEDTMLYHVYDTLPSPGVIEAVEELAKIHATSLKYHEEIKDFSGDYLPEILTDVTNEKNVLSAMLQLMEMLPECTEHLKKVLEKLHIFAFTNYVKAGLDVFKCRVLCHGDLWTPNVMWNKNGRLRSIIDFQLMHSGSPVEDFAMFVITSTSGETRRKDLPQFIERYHAAFEGRCKAMDIDVPFTKQQFADEYEKFVPFELVPLLPFFVPMLDSMVANAKDPVAAKTIFLDKLRGMVEDAGASIDKWYSDQ